MVKKLIVAGNWKMHKETLEGVNFVENVQSKFFYIIKRHRKFKKIFTENKWQNNLLSLIHI